MLASAVVFPTSTTSRADGLLVATFLCYMTCHPVLSASFVLVTVKGYLHIVFCPFAAISDQLPVNIMSNSVSVSLVVLAISID